MARLAVKWLRTLRRFVPFLIGLFMVAQLAGVVSSEEMHPDAGIAAAAADPAYRDRKMRSPFLACSAVNTPLNVVRSSAC